jgi:O-antigen/teichoic acid export membrane protein
MLRASAGVALSQYLARAVVLVRGLVAASVLGPQGFGGWNALNLILDYGYFAPAGALQGLDLRLPAAVARADAAAARLQMAGAWGITLAGAVVFIVLVLVLPGAGARELTASFGAGAAWLMLSAAVLQLAVLYLASVLRAHGRFGAVSRAQTLQALAGGGLGIALLWPWGVWGLITGWIVGTLAAAALMKFAAPEAPLVPAAPGQGLMLLRAGLPIFSFYALSLLLRSTDRLAFVHVGAAAALGHYSLGLMAAGLVLYAPEAVGFVLFPRLAAAAQGARDPVATRVELLRAHHALSVALPFPVALGLIWAGPVVAAWLPDFQDGVPALRLLAFASLLFSVSTLPGYFLLAGGFNRRLLAVGAGAVGLNAVLVFAAAAHDPRPATVALAAVAGYAAFAIGLVAAASAALFARAAERARFIAVSFVPALWTAGVALAATARWDGVPAGALRSTIAVAMLALPLLALFARGLGLLSPNPGRVPAPPA